MTTEWKVGDGYKVRKGLKAGIYWIGEAEDIIHGWYIGTSGRRLSLTWDLAGQACKGVTSGIDLMPPKRVRYTNIYLGRAYDGPFESRAEADSFAGSHRVACVRYEEGQFDD